MAGLRAADELARRGGGLFAGEFGRAFNEDLDGAADESLVVDDGDFLLDGEQGVVAAFLDVGRHVVVHLLGGGAGAGGIFEDERVFEAAAADQICGCQKILLGFAGEADDEVAGDGDAVDQLPRPLDQLDVLLPRVASIHSL